MALQSKAEQQLAFTAGGRKGAVQGQLATCSVGKLLSSKFKYSVSFKGGD